METFHVSGGAQGASEPTRFPTTHDLIRLDPRTAIDATQLNGIAVVETGDVSWPVALVVSWKPLDRKQVTRRLPFTNEAVAIEAMEELWATATRIRTRAEALDARESQLWDNLRAVDRLRDTLTEQIDTLSALCVPSTAVGD